MKSYDHQGPTKMDVQITGRIRNIYIRGNLWVVSNEKIKRN